MSKTTADWSVITRVVELASGTGTLIVGNGDIESVEQGRVKAAETGCDGIMIGRGIFKDPWMFVENTKPREQKNTITKKLKLAMEHTELFDKTYGEKKNFTTMKKFFKMYTTGFDGAKELRVRLMDTKSAEDAILRIEEYLRVL